MLCLRRHASKPQTRKLPYRKADGTVGEAHLPGAIGAVATNNRSAHLKEELAI